MTVCLVCDDHTLVRVALAEMLRSALPGVHLHEAADFTAAVQGMARLRPDLCLTDLRMPGAAPQAGVLALQAAAPPTPILVVTGAEDDLLLISLLQHGIAGFLEKTCDLAVIRAAVQILLSGGRYIPPRILTLLTDLPGQSAAPLPILTPRQAGVLDLASQGLSNKDMARRLSLAPSTVKTHLEEAMRRLDATNRTQAALLWRQRQPDP